MPANTLRVARITRSLPVNEAVDDYADVELSIEGPVAMIRLDRPHKLNALWGWSSG
jgi:hypothetical protein